MRFSVAVTTYNRKKLLKRTLDSLETQSYKDFEVLIIDDGSSDGTDAFIEEFKKTSEMNIRYFYKENGGKPSALNVAIEEARGEFFLILDSDDWMLPEGLWTLQKAWDYIPKESRTNYSGVMARATGPDGVLIGKPFPKDPFISSYVDFHFISGIKEGPYEDCVDFIRTDLIKKYRYPEIEGTKFVPEAFITDQIGMKHHLYCISDVVEIKEYQKEGITQNIDEYKKINVKGMLVYYEILLNKVFPHAMEKVPISSKVYIWYRYLTYSKFAGKKVPKRQMNPLGKIVNMGIPIIDVAYKMRKKIRARKAN